MLNMHEDQIQFDSKVAKILASLRNGMELAKVAKIMGFGDIKEMAEYMRSKGYKWDAGSNGYVLVDQEVANPKLAQSAVKEAYSYSFKSGNEQDLLSVLESHKDKLLEILNEEVPQVPRYILSGINRTKSFYLNYGLELMTKEFSVDKNVSQKDIIEVALVNFFMRYGYRKEVSRLLGR